MEIEWHIWVDTGGTFTDCLARGPDGRMRRCKVLSDSSLRGRIRGRESGRAFRVAFDMSLPDGFPDGFTFFPLKGRSLPAGRVRSYRSEGGMLELESEYGEAELGEGDSFEVVSPEEAPVLAARLATGTPHARPLPPLVMRLATTRGTNALLEGKGAKVAFFVTRGLGDLLRIGDQRRPDLFSLAIEERRSLGARVVEVPERIAADGTPIEKPDRDALEGAVEALREEGVEAAAIALMHGYRAPEAEEMLAAWLRERGFRYVSRSADLAPLIGILPRAETAVADAYLSPVMNDYLDRVRGAVPEGRLYVMTSAGGLVSREHFCAKDSLLSGPAGGVVGAAASGKQAGFGRLIAFDMGGTSTDVSRFDGDFEQAFEHRVGEARLLAPALRIESVAAGGGSICGFDGKRFFVGPESAGARPGPACYGAGGPLTLTDVNLLLGRIDRSLFGIPVFPEHAEVRLEALLDEVRDAGETLSREAALRGFLDIADEIMADAIRRISVREGCDPAEYALVAFGGAGGLHACAVAERLGMRDIVFPADAGLLSARGLKEAVIERIACRQVLEDLDAFAGRALSAFESLVRRATEALAREGLSRDEIEVRRRVAELRLKGQEAVIELDYTEEGSLEAQFLDRFEELFGYRPAGRAIEIASLRVVASGRRPLPEGEIFPVTKRPRSARDGTGFVRRDALEPGDVLEGPYLIQDRYSTLAVAEGWRLLAGDRGTLRLSRVVSASVPQADEARPEVVNLELFTNRFRSLTGEMGVQLERTALSTNIRDRKDFSCALLDERGELVVNAPHVPVHLGALGMCVRAVARELSLRPGDTVVTNHPAFGGSHLPDLTVVTPVFTADGSLLGYVANRAHHAEIGGIRPGSMAPEARCLDDEGVVIPPTFLFREGREHYGEIGRLLRAGRYPSRSLDENLADLNAQAAANRRGSATLLRLAEIHGADTVRHYWRELKRQSSEALGRRLGELSGGEYRGAQELDDGTPLRVRLTVSAGVLEIDFSGSGAVHPGSFNATPGIVQSAVIYVLRLLLREAIPLNEGLMESVKIVLPSGILNPEFGNDPARAPAVAAGNVETSQRIVDTLLLALELAACSQGTMNNIVFGNERASFYETVGGGAGAGDGFHGASGVHTHMTNTAITDPEILEFRYPVRLERFALRQGSGGDGRYRGGDGLIRELRFLAPLSVSLITQHRREGPYGMAGGHAGAPGKQVLVRAAGTRETLAFQAQFEAEAGDRLVLETPGGGGWGSASNHQSRATSNE